MNSQSDSTSQPNTPDQPMDAENPEDGLPRITWSFIGEEILAQLNLEKGLGYTVKNLAADPGGVIKEYVFRTRTRLTKPMTLLLLTSAIATLVSLAVLPGENELMRTIHTDPDFHQLKPVMQRMVELAMLAFFRYLNLMYLSSLPVMAFATWLVLPKGFTSAEHFVINAYFLSFQTIVYTLFLPLMLVQPWLVTIQLLPLIAWTVFAYKSTFDLGWVQALGFSTAVYLITNALYGALSAIGFLAAALVL